MSIATIIISSQYVLEDPNCYLPQTHHKSFSFAYSQTQTKMVDGKKVVIVGAGPSGKKRDQSCSCTMSS
jgi:hypothetical protein